MHGRRPREDFAREEVMLAHSWEGKPLTRQHGGPLRVVIPHLYFWKSPKWVTRIELLGADRPGFWEVRGYHNEADPEQLLCHLNCGSFRELSFMESAKPKLTAILVNAGYL